MSIVERLKQVLCGKPAPSREVKLLATAYTAETMQGWRQDDPPPFNIEALVAPAGVSDWPDGRCDVETAIPYDSTQRYVVLFGPCRWSTAATVTGEVYRTSRGFVGVRVATKRADGAGIRTAFSLILVSA